VPGSVTSLLVLLIGFAVAGLLASGYQLLTARPASFNIFGDGTRPAAVAQVPFLVFAAPFIIMRNTLLGCRVERGNFVPAMIATVISGFWSLMSGTVVIMGLQALGIFQA
jgi:O-antigen/teichoic acid export membrane protein